MENDCFREKKHILTEIILIEGKELDLNNSLFDYNIEDNNITRLNCLLEKKYKSLFEFFSPSN